MVGGHRAESIRLITRGSSPRELLSNLPETSEDFRDMLVRPLGESYLICRNEDGALAGSASLGHIVFGNLRSAYLGYSAFVPHQRRGFMSEGLELVLRHAFGALALHRVEVNVQPDNARSIALAERLGFRREGYSPRYLKIGGRWRDHVRFAMLAEDWTKRRAEVRRGLATSQTN